MRDIDVNKASEPVESSTTKTEPVTTPSAQEQEETEETEQTEQPERVEEEKVEKPEEPEEEPEKPLANKTQERIRNLANENRLLKAQLEAFRNQPAPQLDGEMTVDELNRLVNERAIEAARLIAESKLVENEFRQQVNKWAEDFEQVKKDNPELDPKSPDYDAELDQTLARLMDDGYGNPRTDILVSDVLKTIKKRESKTANRAKEEGKSQATATLAKQMSEGAITPTAKTSSNAGELSDEEMAELRVKNPKEYFKRL